MQGCGGSADQPPVEMIEPDDPAMSAAIATARETIDRFTTEFELGSGESFAVKVPIDSADAREHLWMTVEAFDGTHFDGRISNEPVLVDTVSLGEKYRVAKQDISDWMYLERGRMHGNYTMRARLDTMAPEQAAALRRTLADP